MDWTVFIASPAASQARFTVYLQVQHFLDVALTWTRGQDGNKPTD